MIRYVGGSIIADCDRCGTSMNTGQRSMQQAANYLSRAEGWDSWKRRGEWRNYCPRCVEDGGDPDLENAGVNFGIRPTREDD